MAKPILQELTGELIQARPIRHTTDSQGLAYSCDLFLGGLHQQVVIDDDPRETLGEADARHHVLQPEVIDLLRRQLVHTLERPRDTQRVPDGNHVIHLESQVREDVLPKWE